eukprot:3215758-Prymnesium_polylepis.1
MQAVAAQSARHADTAHTAPAHAAKRAPLQRTPPYTPTSTRRPRPLRARARRLGLVRGGLHALSAHQAAHDGQRHRVRSRLRWLAAAAHGAPLHLRPAGRAVAARGRRRVPRAALGAHLVHRPAAATAAAT